MSGSVKNLLDSTVRSGRIRLGWPETRSGATPLRPFRSGTDAGAAGRFFHLDQSDLDFVATGRRDHNRLGMAVQPEVSLWDVAAVQVIMEEAGGRFTDLDGAARPNGKCGVVQRPPPRRGLAALEPGLTS